MPPAGPDAPSTASLFTPGERVGWILQDRERARRPFTRPEPNAHQEPYSVGMRKYRIGTPKNAMGITLPLALALTPIVSGILLSAADAVLAALIAGVIVILIGLSLCVWSIWFYVHRRRAYDSAVRAFWNDFAQWNDDKVRFYEAETARISQLPEWGAAVLGPETKRFDVIGGTTWGWEALMTVYGSSLLATHGNLTVLDLTGKALGAELLTVAEQHGFTVDSLQVPDRLDESGLLVGLSGRDLVDCLIEAIHSGEETASRPERSVDDRILSAVCDTLGAEVSMARIVAALQALMNHPGDLPALTTTERHRIAHELFSEEYRQQAQGRLQVLESFLHPLVGLGDGKQDRPAAALTCLTMAAGGGGVRNELLIDLIVQWVIRRIADDSVGRSSLMVAGADDIPRRHLDRLSDLCERRGMRLVLLFRHLRGAATETFGEGTVGFMRLGNHAEATLAADSIGREHKFVLSQVSTNLGGTDTRTTTEMRSEGRSTGGTVGYSRGMSVTAQSENPTVSANATASVSRSWSTTRSWGTTRGRAEATNWGQSESSQRVHEYTVEPQQLQDLPEYAMLLVRRRNGTRDVVPVECNPDLVSVPGVSMDQLPEGTTMKALPQEQTATPDLPPPPQPQHHTIPSRTSNTP